MARTKQTARQSVIEPDSSEAASQPPNAPPAPPLPPPAAPPPPPLQQQQQQQKEKQNEAAASKPFPISKSKKKAKGMSRSFRSTNDDFDDRANTPPSTQEASSLSFISGDDLIVGKSRLKAVDRSSLKPVELTPDSFQTFQKEKAINLFAAKSYLTQIVKTKQVTRLSLNGMDQLNDIFFKLLVDAYVDMPALEAFHCSGCPLVTDTGLRWLQALAPNLREVKVAGCPKVTSASLSFLLKFEPALDNLDMSGTGVTTVPVTWGDSGVGLKVDGCSLICPSFPKFIQHFKTSAERKSCDSGVGLNVNGCSLIAPSYHKFQENFTKARSSYVQCSVELKFIHQVKQFKVVILRRREFEFSLAEFLKSNGEDSKPNIGQPLTILPDVAFGDMHLNIFEVDRRQSTQDLIISDGCVCMVPFALEKCVDEAGLTGMVIYLTGKVSFITAKRLNLVAVLVGVNTTGIDKDEARKILDTVLDGVRKNIADNSRTASEQVVTMTRRAWRIDELELNGQLYTGEAAATADYLERFKLFGEVLHADEKPGPDLFAREFGYLKEELDWFCVNSTDASDLEEKYMMNQRILPFAAVAERAHDAAKEISFHNNQMTYPCLEQVAIGLHQRGLAVFKPGVKGSPFVSDMDWFAKVLAIVMDPPKQDAELAKQIRFVDGDTPVWTDDKLKATLGSLVTAEQYVLVVKLLKSCGCLIEAKVDRLTKIMPSYVYMVADKLSDDPKDIVEIDKLWPKVLKSLRDTVQIDKYYRFTSGIPMSLLPKFFGRCAKFFKFTLLKKYGALLRKGGMDLLVDAVPGLNAHPTVIFSCRLESQVLESSNCREHYIWSCMNLATTIMDYCLKEEGIYANVTVPCPTCIPSRDRTRTATDPGVYHYFLHLINAGKDRGLKCHSKQYDCYDKQDERVPRALIGPVMDFTPKHLSYMLAEVSSSLPTFSRCSLCQNCAVDGKKCDHNGLQEGSVCHCGCKQSPKMPICPGCGICWKCTKYLKKLYYTLYPQSIRNIRFTSFETDKEEGKPGKEEEMKALNNSWFQVSNSMLYVIKNTKFTAEKFNRFDLTTYRGNVLSIGILGTPPGGIYGPLLTYNLNGGSIGREWKGQQPLASDRAWRARNCTAVSFRLRNPEEGDEKAKTLGYRSVIVDIYKMGVKIWSEYLQAMKLEIGIYGEGSCNVILATPTICTDSDIDRYHPEVFSKLLYVELELEKKGESDKEVVLVCPLTSARASGLEVFSDAEALPTVIKNDDPRIHPLGYTFNQGSEKKVYLLNTDAKFTKEADPALNFENLQGEVESVKLAKSMKTKKAATKGFTAARNPFGEGEEEQEEEDSEEDDVTERKAFHRKMLKVYKKQNPYLDIGSVYALSKWIDKGLMKAAPLWLFSEVQRAGWEPSVIDVFGCTDWYKSSEALVTAFARSKKTLDETVRKRVDVQEGDGLALLMFPKKIDDIKLRFQMRPRQMNESYQLLPLCNTTTDKVDVHLMNKPGLPVSSIELSEEAKQLYHHYILPLQIYMATEYKAVLPGHDELLGKFSLGDDQVLYAFRELLLQVTYNLMVLQADSPSRDMQEMPEEILSAVNKFKTKIGFKEEEDVKCPAHQVANNFMPADMNTVPGLKPYVQFLKNVKLSQNVDKLPDDSLSELKQIETLGAELCCMTELPKNIAICKNLTTLKLAGSNIASLPPNMSALSDQLTYLDISKTKIKVALPVVITSLLSLKTLMADHLHIGSFPPGIGNLKNLEHLSVKGSRLDGLPASFIELKSLKSLSISGVPWMEVKPGSLVTADYFTEFMANWNMTEEIMRRREEFELLMKITTDKTLTLDHREVGQLNAILYQLFTRLGFFGDKKPDADSIGGFPAEILELENLTHLDISYQGIVSVPGEISNLSRLTSLTLGPNPYLTTLPGTLGFLPLQRLVIDDCPSIRTPPPEICSKGFAAVLAYLRRLQAGSVSCKRTKLMMVGLGGAGKTSLVRALMSGDQTAHLASGEAITDGIDIHSWTIKKNNDAVTYSVWDFAGQTVYYNTHQFFLSNRAVYLLMWNIRLGYEHAGLDFWLSSISVHSPQAPILVVGTHLDQVSKYEIPIDELSARYPQIVGFHFISTYNGTGVEDLQNKLLDVTLQQKYMGEMIPEVWLNFEENILKQRKENSVIDYDVVAGLAINSGIFDSVETSQAVHFLHELGTLQHFDNEFLKDRVVINPQWIVDVMACVVSVKDSYIKNGRLKHRDIGHIWKDFPSELHEWLLRLTEEFDLTFPLPDQAMNLVPCLLPEKEPGLHWPEVDRERGCRETKMEYEFAYLPVGLFNRGQVRLYEYSDSSVIWKRGSLLKKNGHLALVTQSRDSKLKVKCQGPRPENILFMIHEVFETLIQESFQGVHYDFRVPCPECLKIGHEPFMFNGSTIRRATGLKAPFLQCVKNFHIISIADLNGICPPDDSQDYDLHLQNTVRSLVDLREELSADIFISYCEADVPKSGEKMLEPKKIKDCLENAGYRCWFEDVSDKDNLEERVLALRDAKIFLVMMSTNYINDQTCCNMFKFARTVLKKPVQLVTVGPPSGHEWKQSALGMLVADEVYVNFQKVELFEPKSQDLLKALTDRTIGLVEKDDKPECFISYCWSNSQRAVNLGQRTLPGAIGASDPRDLKDYLEEKGMKTWLDIERAGKGGLFEDIAEGLRDAKVMIACVSDEYADSLNCQMEFRFAAKALSLPIVIAVYGTGHRWRSSEIGMLSLQYLQVGFQDRSETAADKVMQFVKSHVKSRDPREVAKAKRAKDDANKKHQKTSYQELYELAQRKFLRQISSYADVYELQPYPRIVIVDFAEPESLDKQAGDGKKDEPQERPKLVRRQTSMMLNATPFLQRNLCFRILCEHEQGWHLEAEAIPAPPGWNQKVVKYAPYLARVMAVVRHSSKIQLNCLGGVEGEKYIRWLEENCNRTEEGTDVKDAYQELRKSAIDADTGKTLGGLSRCHLASGKIFWLCKRHQTGPRMTILSNSDATITHAPTDSAVESSMLENLRPLDTWEKQAEEVRADRTANPKPKPIKTTSEEETANEPVALDKPNPTEETEKPIEEQNSAKQEVPDPENANMLPSLIEEENRQMTPIDGPGPSVPFKLEDDVLEAEKPAERPDSAASQTSVRDRPIPARRTSVSSTSSRRASTSSRTSRRLSNVSVKSQSQSGSVAETPQPVDEEARRRFRTAGIVVQTVEAAHRGEQRKKDATAKSQACDIL